MSLIREDDRIIIYGAALVVLVAILCTLFFNPTSQRVISQEIKEKIDSTTVTSSYYLTTIVHDEHLFVYSNNFGHIIHHPNCPCNKTVVEKPEIQPLPPIIIDGTRSVLINK